MAEVAVELAIQTLGAVIGEIKILGSAKQEVESIKSELESIRSFLEDADARAAAEEEGESNRVVSTWVRQVREEAYRIEDVIDEFSYAVAQLPHGGGLLAVLYKISRSVKKLKLRREIVNEIEAIKSSLASKNGAAKSYGFRPSDQVSNGGSRNAIPHDSGVGAFFIDDSEVVGIDSIRDDLIGRLNRDIEKRTVIVLVGDGGRGKTTLAGKIYNNCALKKFNCQAWITIGKESNKKNILTTIIQKFHCPTRGEIDEMDENELITTLRKYLGDKSYMVVFDDVWKIQFWEDVKYALFDNNKSSRIMLTTRDKRVAEFIPFPIVHMLDPLALDDALKLFNKIAFGPDRCCPPELRELSTNIVEKCDGLPLAIAAIGGLLSTKTNPIEWQKLLDDLGSKLGNDHHLRNCNRILLESYYDLPHQLKSCFLYFGLFPESYAVSCGRLKRLWMAEGFVQYNKHSQAEQVAEAYLTELIARSLVQVVNRDISGRPRSCKVHDLMYEIILRKTKELDFSRVLEEEDSSDYSKTRRISIDGSTDRILERIKDSKIRAALLFTYNLPDSFMTTFVADLKLIKVLDFQNCFLRYLPEGVGNLFHLHCLNLRNTRVKILPKSIGKLVNLESLDLMLSYVTELPVVIRNLKKLRYLRACNLHLTGDSTGRGCKIQGRFGTLTDLQKLYFVQADNEVLTELMKLRQLRKLGVTLTNGSGKNLCASIANMENLESLIVDSTSREEIIEIESMSSPPKCLQRLGLMGTMKKLPDWILKLQYLSRIDLDLTGLSENPISVLQSLPNLLELRYKDTHNDVQLHFKEGWFRNLQELILLEFKALEIMMIDKGAMPNLRRLEIVPCPQLKTTPTGIEHMRNLKILKIVNTLSSLISIATKRDSTGMKQELIVKAQMRCHRCRVKAQMRCHLCRATALKTIATVDGVLSVAMQGLDEDTFTFVVIGEGIDPVQLVQSLR